MSKLTLKIEARVHDSGGVNHGTDEVSLQFRQGGDIQTTLETMQHILDPAGHLGSHCARQAMFNAAEALKAADAPDTLEPAGQIEEVEN